MYMTLETNTLYIPKYHVNSGTNGNINNGGTYTTTQIQTQPITLVLS